MQTAKCKVRIRATQSAMALLCCMIAATAIRAEQPQAEFELETIRGRVVYLAEVLEKRAGVASVPEAKDRMLALETKEGALIPLVEDVRGRAFRRDERLRSEERRVGKG